MFLRATTLIVLAVATGILTGCYESTDVVIHEPQKYQGAGDPLLQQQASSREEQLRKRFDLVQRDR